MSTLSIMRKYASQSWLQRPASWVSNCAAVFSQTSGGTSTASSPVAAMRNWIHAAFVAAVQPLLADARKMYGEEMFRLLPNI